MTKQEQAVIDAARAYVARPVLASQIAGGLMSSPNYEALDALTVAVREMDRRTWEISPIESAYDILGSKDGGEYVRVFSDDFKFTERVCRLLNESEGKP